MFFYMARPVCSRLHFNLIKYFTQKTFIFKNVVYCIFNQKSKSETSQVLLAGVSGGFPAVLPFRPPIDWLVSMSEIILKGTLN